MLFLSNVQERCKLSLAMDRRKNKEGKLNANFKGVIALFRES